MALPSSGPISLLQIALEYGGAAPYPLTRYYGVAPGIPTSGAISLFQFLGKSNRGEQIFTASGTFTVPAGVTSICFVAVGAGGPGNYDGTGVRAGAGGGLGYKNGVAVTPGQQIAVTINGSLTELNIAGTKYTVTAGSYNQASGVNVPGTFTSGNWTGGGTGGNAGIGYNCGGGGAAGYGGNGGNGGLYSSTYAQPTAGSGGGGGGGGGVYSSYFLGADRAPTGGGVGLYGIGANGAAGVNKTGNEAGNIGVGGGGGSGGASGTNYGSYGASQRGGNYGGGNGGIGSQTELNRGNTAPGPGAVRIIWGLGRSFPYAAA